MAGWLLIATQPLNLLYGMSQPAALHQAIINQSLGGLVGPVAIDNIFTLSLCMQRDDQHRLGGPAQ